MPTMYGSICCQIQHIKPADNATNRHVVILQWLLGWWHGLPTVMAAVLDLVQ
jgi:hypothetical protein